MMIKMIEMILVAVALFLVFIVGTKIMISQKHIKLSLIFNMDYDIELELLELMNNTR